MQHELSQHTTLFPPGASVVLKADPEGDIMTVTDVRTDGSSVFYSVAWLDERNARRDAEYVGSDLKRAEE